MPWSSKASLPRTLPSWRPNREPRALLTALALLLSTLTTACAGPQKAVFTNPGEGVPTAKVLLEYHASRPLPESLQGITRMRIETPGRNNRFRGVLLASTPQSMRVELLSVLGTPVAYLVAGDGGLTLYSPYNDTVLTTSNASGILARVAGATVGMDDLVGLLMGRVPACNARERGHLQEEGGSFTVQCMDEGEISRTLVFDAQSWLLRSVTGRSSQAGTFQVILDDHRPVGADPASAKTVPYHVELTAPALGLNAELDYDEITVDAAIDPALFKLTVPPGLPHRTFEELLEKAEAARAAATQTPPP